MLGGTYHNGTLLKDGNTYINDWLSTDGGDNIRGFVNFGMPRIAIVIIMEKFYQVIEL